MLPRDHQTRKERKLRRKLEKKRRKLQKKLVALDQRLRELGPSNTPRKPARRIAAKPKPKPKARPKPKLTLKKRTPAAKPQTVHRTPRPTTKRAPRKRVAPRPPAPVSDLVETSSGD